MKPSVPNNNFPENNDYISRQRALERIHAVGGTGAAPDTWADGYDKGVDAAYKTVQSAPAADVRPVVYAEWLTKERQENYPNGKRLEVIYCSNCRKRSILEYDFCPSCGADMRGGGTGRRRTGCD